MVLLLASGSQIRAALLRQAGLDFDVCVPRLDEPAIRSALEAEGASPRDMADALAEMKARRVAERRTEALVIGCDQVLSHQGGVLGKPASPEEARAQLSALRGTRHELLSAAVICRGGQPVWRHVGVVRLTMREFSDGYLDDYLERNWDSIRHSVGGYKLEEEGVRLFTRIEGDYFTVLGLPLMELLGWLTTSGKIEG